MTMSTNVQALNINDLKRYSPEARVNQPVLMSKDVVTRMNCYEPGQVTPFHVHPDDDEIVLCVEGRGAVTFRDREAVPLTPGAIVNLPAELVTASKRPQTAGWSCSTGPVRDTRVFGWMANPVRPPFASRASSRVRFS